MLKRITLLLLALALVFGCHLTAQARDVSQEEMYTVLQEELLRYLNGEEGAIPLDDLATQFNNLGRYKKSTLFGYYTALLRDAEAGDFTNLELYTRLLRLDADFCTQLPEKGFPTVDEVEAYALGRQAEAAGDWPAAIAYYEQSIAVLDSLMRVMDLLTAEPVLVAEGVVSGDYVLDTYSDRTCTIRAYTGSASTLSIPQTISGYQVTNIGESAFSEYESLVSISIPNSVTSISAKAFFYCSSLSSITIPYGVTSIGDKACFGCRALTDIVIPESITSIGNFSFAYCDSLTSFTIPNSVTTLGANPFRGCINLTSINVLNTHPTLEVIDSALFHKIAKRLIAFPCALEIENYVLPTGTLVIGDYAFCNCASLSSITLPDSLTTIGDSAFYNCDNISSISLPDSVNQITTNPFRLCDQLSQIRISSDNPYFEVINGVVFDKINKRLVSYPYSCTASTYTVPEGTLIIENDAFCQIKILTSVTLPDTITHIGSYAFNLCPYISFRVADGSYAHQYAIENNIPYTTY